MKPPANGAGEGGAARPIRILHLEDHRADALLIRSVLESEGVDCEIVNVETRPEFENALETGSFDAVLSDYSLPTFDGATALRILRERHPDLPFLFVSGSMGEDVAIDSLKAGATDYVLKERLARLVPSLQRALAEARGRRERRIAEEARRASDERNRLLAAIVESSDDAIVSTDLQGSILTWNSGAERLYGYRAQEMMGRSVSILESDATRGEVGALLERLQAGQALHKYETERARKDGTPVEVAVSLFPIPGASGITGAASIARDITERKRAEEALHASEERYRLLFESNPQPMWVFDEKTLAFLAINEAACRHYGYTRDEFRSMTIRDLRQREEIPVLMKALSDEPREYPEPGVWRHRTKAGLVIEVEVTSHPLRFDGRDAQLVLANDVTERRELEGQLRQSQKMEAVGQLAGGIAHDFNNLLTAILGYADLLVSRAEISEGAREEANEIRNASERAAMLTRQLLAFSRKQILEPVVLRVDELIEKLEKLLRRVLGEDLALVTHLDPTTGSVRADPGQLEQVIMNLAVNARDAMPRGGQLTIEVRNVDLDEGYSQRHRVVRPGPYVMIAVSDTGIGMDEATREHVFEPFFTTKEKGKGTGLGLSMVYGIVKQSNGYIWIYSEPGMGTAVKVYLPRVAESPSLKEPALLAGSLSGTETILLVEDEETVRNLSRRVLTASGYRVLEAANGIEALSLVLETTETIDLILTDLVMPGMSGTDLASRLTADRSGLPVIFMSGYTDDAVVRHGLVEPGRLFLQKPFTPEILLRKVREALAMPAA